MGLQVRLRHALGERLMDLADRPPERPLVVGRAREADLKIPSVSVATEHCALFVHEGAWVVQDTSGGSTWVNGEPIVTPTPLYVGDVISLGNDASPATIEVDPAGVAQGRTGEAAMSNAAAPARGVPAAAAPRGGVGQAPARPQGGYYQAPAMSAPPAQAGGYAAEGSGEQGDFMDWGQPAGASAAAGAGNATPSYKRRKQQQSSAPLFIGIVAGVMIVGGSAWFAYTKLNPPPPPPAPKVVAEEPTRRSNNIFDDMNPSAKGTKAKPAGASSGAAPAPAKPKPPGDSADAPREAAPDPDASSSSAAPAPPRPPAAPADGHADEKAWDEVESARNLPDQAQAIMKFDDYRRQHPNDSEKDLTAYTDFALNQLWWQRVAQLVKKRDKLTKDAATHARDLHDEPNPAFKKTLAEEKQKIDTDLAKTLDFLANEMAYTGDEVPDVTDAAMLEKLSATRDADKYGAWKTRTARFIRSHHGATPWAGDD